MLRHIVLLFLFTALAALYGCRERAEVAAPESRPAKIYKVKSGDEKNIRRYPAIVEANEKNDASFKVSGRVIELRFKQGQEVKKGDLMARLDARDYELARNRAKSQLEATQAQERAMKIGARPEDIRILQNNVAAAKTKMDRDERYYLDRKGLVERGAITRQSLETAEASFRISKEDYENAVKELEKGKSGARKEDIEAIEAKVRDLQENLRNTENALADTQLIAPFDARINIKYVEPFEEVNAKQPIYNLQEIDLVKLSFSLPENVVFNLEKKNVGTFTAVFDGMPGKEFPVDLHEFRIEANEKTRTFTCWVAMRPPQDAIVLPGMTAEIIHYNPREGQGGFRVPSSSLFADPSKSYFVWKIDATTMTVHKAAVEVGKLSGDDAWVKEGLNDGDQIAAAGVNYLVEGMKVHPLDTKD